MVAALVDKYQQRRDLMVKGLNAIRRVSCQIPQGAFYVFPNVSAFNTPARQLSNRLLGEAGAAVLPGADFGKFGKGYLGLCYATSGEEIENAIDRIAKFLSGGI